MADLYSDMQALASGLLAPTSVGGFGQGAIRHIKLTPAAGPVNNPGKPTETPTVMPGGTVQGVPQFYIANGLAIAGDLMVTLPVVAGLVLAMADLIEVNAVRYRIVQIEPVPPSGTVVVYKLIVRKG